MTDIPTEADVRLSLAELPDLCTRLAKGDIDGPQRTAIGHRSPVNERSVTNLAVVDALDVRRKPDAEVDRYGYDPNRQGILPTLDQWAVLLEADMYDRSPNLPTELPDPPTVADLCGWLDEHLHWWVAQPQWDEFGPAMVHQWKRAKALAGVRPDDVQRCNICGGVVEHVGTDVYRCRGCGKERSLRSVMDVSLPQAAEMTGTSLRTLQDWAKRHLFEPLDPTASERKRRFDLNEIRRVRDEQTERRAARIAS